MAEGFRERRPQTKRRSGSGRRLNGRVAVAAPARPKGALVIMAIFIVFLIAAVLVLMGL
jgi:hypothetical protein